MIIIRNADDSYYVHNIGLLLQKNKTCSLYMCGAMYSCILKLGECVSHCFCFNNVDVNSQLVLSK